MFGEVLCEAEGLIYDVQGYSGLFVLYIAIGTILQ